MRAWLALRDGVHYRRAAFETGLEAAGYAVTIGLPRRPSRGDVLVIWNRYGQNARMADAFEFEGLPVLVAENGYLGNEYGYAISRSQHNGAGTWPQGGPERWDGLGITLSPWRKPGGECVVLPQRGIGPPGVAMPLNWPARVSERLKANGVRFRVRSHPGQKAALPLEKDLAFASEAITWGSGAALKALTMGIRVRSDMPGWIGLQDNTDAGRLAMFRRLAWAQWTLAEITAGMPFRRLLCEF
jgi:hypothetical protein